MAYVALVTALALIEYMVFTGFVGWARGRFGVDAPAISGHPEFERYFRVQQNTLEQLIVFLPALWIFAQFVSAPIATALGAAFIVGRLLYFRSYVRDPKSRTIGFVIGYLSVVILVLGAAGGAVRAAL